MPTYSYNGISLEYAEKVPVITLANSNVEQVTDVYVTFYLTNVLDSWSGVTWERTPTVFSTGQINASSGSITAFTQVGSQNFYAIPLDSNLYIYKATYTPPQNASQDVLLTIPSSSVFSYSYLDVTGVIINGQTGQSSYTTQTRNVKITNGDSATVTVDTQYDLIIIGGPGNDTLTGGAGNDTLNGGAGNDILIGGLGDDWLEYTDDIHIGLPPGNDTLYGGLGDDTYVVDVQGGATLVELQNEGIDSVYTKLASYALEANVENLTHDYGVDLGETNYRNFVGTGNALNNVITSNGGNDSLDGGAGNDILNGGAGNDILNGGAGNDTLIGGAGNDTLNGGEGDDSITVYFGGDESVTVVDGGNGENSLSIQGDWQTSSDLIGLNTRFYYDVDASNWVLTDNKGRSAEFVNIFQESADGLWTGSITISERTYDFIDSN